MDLTFGLASIQDLFAKLERDGALLNDEVTADRLFNFVVTGYSLIDWVKNDLTMPASASSQSELNALYRDQWLKVCGDLATACKHFKLTNRTPVTQPTDLEQGWESAVTVKVRLASAN